jgi:hypothetical protein
MLKKHKTNLVLSFPRKREPSQTKQLDSRFRGNDNLFFLSVTKVLVIAALTACSAQRTGNEPACGC